MTTLELFRPQGVTLADHLRRAAQARAVEAVVKEIKQAVDAALHTEIGKVQEATGTAYTARADGVTGVLTDPQPKPRVSDVEAFAGWWVGQGFEHQTVERVEIVDHAVAAEILACVLASHVAYELDATQLADLDDAVKVVTDTLLPDDPIDVLTGTGRCVVTADALVDTETGEQVPGVTVNTGSPTVQVRVSKEAKAGLRRQVLDSLGAPPELDDDTGAAA